MTGIQRWNTDFSAPHPDGDYVRYEDHLAALGEAHIAYEAGLPQMIVEAEQRGAATAIMRLGEWSKHAPLGESTFDRGFEQGRKQGISDCIEALEARPIYLIGAIAALDNWITLQGLLRDTTRGDA